MDVFDWPIGFPGRANLALLAALEEDAKVRPTAKPRLAGPLGFRVALMDGVMPALFEFKPDLIIISAGQ
jgi:hypothetical protein